MKLMILILTALAVSGLAHATSQELTKDNSGAGKASVYTGGLQASVKIDGDAARVLYIALDVKPVGHFSLVQTQTKTTDLVECVQAILGDVPGKMSGPRYSCTILVDKTQKVDNE
jgi:hypothetical protein